MTAPERRPSSSGGARGRRVSERVLEMVTDRMRVVAEPTRVRILWHLESDGGSTVQEICDGIGRSHQNVSKHLGVLYGAGLVSRSRERNSVRYELVDWTALWVIEKMTASLTAQLQEQHERLLRNATIDGIITTNFDPLLEYIRPDLEPFVGQDELLFANSQGIGEIYKDPRILDRSELACPDG